MDFNGFIAQQMIVNSKIFINNTISLYFMKKKIIIIFILIFVILVIVPFLIEKAYYKNGQMISMKIPMDSFCENKQNSNSIISSCTYSGGDIMYDESEQGKINFKRELTNNNCYTLNLKDYIITSAPKCTINESMKMELNRDLLAKKYNTLCSPTGKYCIEFKTLGKETGGSGGIGFISSPVSIYGLEIFKVIDKTKNDVLYREAKIHIGGSPDITASTYWGDNDSFLLFERDKKLYYLRLK